MSEQVLVQLERGQAQQVPQQLVRKLRVLERQVLELVQVCSAAQTEKQEVAWSQLPTAPCWHLKGCYRESVLGSPELRQLVELRLAGRSVAQRVRSLGRWIRLDVQRHRRRALLMECTRAQPVGRRWFQPSRSTRELACSNFERECNDDDRAKIAIRVQPKLDLQS